ncbi:MAG: hypothetical protein HY817_05710 [Candidatus Abawacabacteria bacterium]|nr:hypothetical protein [Candidatus Abawacabacteria bacterium]
MKALLLPGNNRLANEVWIETIAGFLRTSSYQPLIHRYHHWDNNAHTIDLTLETNLLPKGSFDFIFAKSAGVLLALIVINAGTIKVKKCCFVGTPLHFAFKVEVDMSALLRNYHVPTLFLQKTADPAASHQELFSLLNEPNLEQVVLKELPGDSHDYTLAELQAYLTNFLLS